MDAFTRAGRLTRAQRIALAAGVPLTVAAIGWGGLNAAAAVGRGTESFSMPVPVRDGTVSAHVSNGDVIVGGGSAARLTGTVHYSLIRPTVTMSVGAAIGADCSLPVGSCGLDARLTVPASVSGLNVSSDMGDLTVGSVGASTLTLSTSMGDIRASGLTAADVSLNSDMGDVTVVFLRPPDKLTVTDSMGDIKIVLPAGPTTYRVSAASSMGDVSYGGIPRDSASSHVIDLTTSMGDITITQAG